MLNILGALGSALLGGISSRSSSKKAEKAAAADRAATMAQLFAGQELADYYGQKDRQRISSAWDNFYGTKNVDTPSMPSLAEYLRLDK